MKKILGLILFLIQLTTYGQNNTYDIKINLEGFNDSVFYLVSYYADKFQSIDTATMIDNSVSYEGTKNLEPGIYILAGEKMNKYFEFIVDDGQAFSISVTKDNLIESLQSEYSNENQQFFEYLKFNKNKFDTLTRLQQDLPKAKPPFDSQIRNQIETIKQEVNDYKTNYILQNPNALLSKIFLGMKEPEIDPDLPMELSYQIYKQEYWKTIDLTDKRMIRTPILHNKLINYIDKLVVQHPDSLIKDIDKLLSLPMAEEIKNHFIWHLTLKYEYPEIMGLDKVFVHMVDHYFRTNQITGISQNIIENIEKRAKKISKTLIGELAPDLIMLDTLEKARSLYEIKANYTLVLFWDQECQVCQKEIKLLKQFLADDPYGIQVFAVGTDTDTEGWKKYIRENDLNWINVNGNQSFSVDYHELYDIFSTPTIYLLDKNKRIIAKRISVEQLLNFIQNYQISTFL